ncbi:hypothetical protein PVT67_01960 [Gallaecimonas kandeliae]|uniref:hypothetical protein n=1 Tax=Gallaecimonas kandeliae TaxID=3029055 RepID=UPI0026485B18|nr:hypothetical protein [Gallaecimonas kandeliae]WKE66037.1 hypothetical protein PVT67_01955 [Gallaecimonas kandeliae]WKE66038.1 hypothetical protein PVT67_01960 [Gallaecimonas kandeliae]
MDYSKLHQGALCATRQGNGWIVSVDWKRHKIKLQDQKDRHEFEADFSALLDEPQVHNPEDGYY